MLIATFGPTTGWAGKSISYDNGRFSLEGHGLISAADVLTYDGQGHLIWADDGLRGLVQQTLPPSEPPVPTPTVTPQPTTTEMREKAPQTPVPTPAFPVPPPVVTPPPTTPIYVHEPPPVPVSLPPKPIPPGGTHGWAAAWLPSDTVEGIFEDRAAFAWRIIRSGGMEELGRKTRYVNLSCAGHKNVAQIHPQADGIALVLKYPGDNLPAVLFDEIPVASLTGYKNPNKLWLDGHPHYNKKGPALAFLIPDEVVDLGDDDREWQDIVKLLKYSWTL